MFTDEIGRAEAMKNLEVSLGDIKPEHVHVDEPELEDVFVALLLREATAPGSSLVAVVGFARAEEFQAGH